MQAAADNVYVDPALYEYAVRLATATRTPRRRPDRAQAVHHVRGEPPSLDQPDPSARALAFVRGRDYALPEDVLDMALDVLRHRLVLSFEALSDDVTSDAC